MTVAILSNMEGVPSVWWPRVAVGKLLRFYQFPHQSFQFQSYQKHACHFSNVQVINTSSVITKANVNVKTFSLFHFEGFDIR